MNILKISRLSVLWLCLLVTACADDKGNYTYEDKAVITIDGISQRVAVLAGAEYIDLKPVVTSNLEKFRGRMGGRREHERPLYVGFFGCWYAFVSFFSY